MLFVRQFGWRTVRNINIFLDSINVTININIQLSLSSIVHPDLTIMVEWVLKTKYLYIQYILGFTYVSFCWP